MFRMLRQPRAAIYTYTHCPAAMPGPGRIRELAFLACVGPIDPPPFKLDSVRSTVKAAWAKGPCFSYGLLTP